MITGMIKEHWERDLEKMWPEDTSTAGGRWRRQHKTELTGAKGSP